MLVFIISYLLCPVVFDVKLLLIFFMIGVDLRL